MKIDWSKPFRVQRYAVLAEPVAGEPWDGVAFLGRLCGADGTEQSQDASVAGWPGSFAVPDVGVWTGFDEANLYIKVESTEPDTESLTVGEGEIWRNDHISICIDPQHSHWRYLYIVVTPDGRCEATWQHVHYGWLAADLRPVIESQVRSIRPQVARRRDGWAVRLTVPLAELALDAARPGTCMGFNVNRWRAAGREMLLQWSPTYGLVHDARLFGDLYLGRPSAALREVHLGGPNWGPNRGYAVFEADGAVDVWIELNEGLWPEWRDIQRVEPDRNGNVRVALDYIIDPRDIMEGELVLRWRSAEGGKGANCPESRASFVFGWKRSVLLTHAAGREGRPGRPEAFGQDFFSSMCDWLLSRLPAFRRVDGRYLVSDDLRIDLLSEDPLLPMAKVICKRIESTHDRLAAAALILCQREVLVSSGAMSRVVAQCDAATVLWYGGAFCDMYSLVLAELIRRIGALQGQDLEVGSWSCRARGRSATSGRTTGGRGCGWMTASLYSTLSWGVSFIGVMGRRLLRLTICFPIRTLQRLRAEGWAITSDGATGAMSG